MVYSYKNIELSQLVNPTKENNIEIKDYSYSKFFSRMYKKETSFP